MAEANARREQRQRERHAEFLETIRKPHWCEQFREKYQAAVYWDGWEEEGASYVLYVFEVGSGKVIGERYATYDTPNYCRELAEQIISNHERWKPIPKDEEPLRPKADVERFR